MLFDAVLRYVLLVWLPVWGNASDPSRLQYRNFVNTSTIIFQLFTRRNPVEPQILVLGNTVSVQLSNFNPYLETKIFAHGWNSEPATSYPVRNEYLKREDCNFIAVDWSHLATGLFYPRIATRYVPATAKHISNFIDFLIELTGASIEMFHLIGHSLGAHAVGEAGAAVTAGRIPRITGLDPAGPLFTIGSSATRLDKRDADFVDIIHTNSGNLFDGELSFLPPVGHADFYPNGGRFQPGCTSNNIEASVHGRSACDHSRAIAYFAESINSKRGFRAVQCNTEEEFFAGFCAYNDAVFMGDPTPATTRGIYYLVTNSRSPYARG